MSIEARQIQETLYSYTAILNFTPQGLHAKFGACSIQNAQLLTQCANVAKCQRCKFSVGVWGQASQENFIFFLSWKTLFAAL